MRATGLCCWALFLSGFLFFLGAWSFARVGAPPHLTLRHVNGVRGFKRVRERHTGGYSALDGRYKMWDHGDIISSSTTTLFFSGD